MPLKVPAIPGSPRIQVALKDVGAGANLKASRFTIPPNMMKILLNFILVEDGSLLGRRGTRQWNAASLGATPVNGATRQYFSGNNQFLVASGGTVWLGNDALKTFTASLAGLTVGASAWFVQYLNFVYLATTADAPQKYDGTTWT